MASLSRKKTERFRRGSSAISGCPAVGGVARDRVCPESRRLSLRLHYERRVGKKQEKARGEMISPGSSNEIARFRMDTN